MAVLPTPTAFDATVPVAIIGGGACGLVAGLATAAKGAEVVILERDAVPQGSTALSSGLIPACGSAVQRSQGIDDSVGTMSGDILAKAHHETDKAMVEALCEQSSKTIDWLNAEHGLEFSVLDAFLYPGHRVHRMHGTPARTGTDLIGRLTQAVEAAGIPIVTEAHVTDLFADPSGTITGLRYERPDGSAETLGCQALILACNGFGGNPDMVRELIPDMADANYFGHVGNQGDAIRWGRDLGADMADLGSFQGHGSVAQPHGILISWALMMEGAIQVNLEGRRFSNEHTGYSEQARRVIHQPEATAWNIFDERLHALGMDFEDFRQAKAAGAVREASSVEELAAVCGLPADALQETLSEAERLAKDQATDGFGRAFLKPALRPPYFAVRVTGAVFHTQGGLVVGPDARVKRPDGSALPNLFAGGGAARGLSGPDDWGYLSGNGLLTAITLGHIAGERAAEQAAEGQVLEGQVLEGQVLEGQAGEVQA